MYRGPHRPVNELDGYRSDGHVVERAMEASVKHAWLVCSLMAVGSALAAQEADSAHRYAPVRTTTDLLVGRIPGVLVSPGAGLTGSGNRVRIRGHASLILGNRPVVYVDGVRIEGMAHDRTMVDRGPSPFDDIDPDNIDSIVVVRGPATGGTYGPEAATGVILVYTSRGHDGPPRWHAYAEEGRLWDGTNWPTNYGGVDADSPDSLYRNGGCTLDAQARGLCTRDFIQSFSPLEANSQFRTVPRRRGGLSVTGGAGRLRYAGGVTGEGETGIYELSRAETDRLTAQGFPIRDQIREPNALRRLRAHARVGVQVTSWAELEVWGNVGSHSLRPGPDLSLVANGLRGYSDPALNDGWVVRPGALFQPERTQEVDHRTGGIRVATRVNRLLTVNALAGWHRQGAGELDLTRYGEGPRIPGESQDGFIATRDATINHRTLSIEASVEYRVRGLAAFSTLGIRHTRRDVHDSTFSGFGLPQGVTDPDSAPAWAITVLQSKTPLLAFFIAQRFAWRDRVALTVGLRADRRKVPRVDVFPFPPRGGGHDWTGHPNIEVEWSAARPAAGALNRLDLHAAYGTADQRLWFETLLAPERTAEGELGARAELWGGRAMLDATFYARRLTDGLTVVTGLVENSLRVHNTGVELGLTVAPLQDDRLRWTVGLVAWGNRNRVPSLVGLGVGLDQSNRPGYPYFGYWGRRYTYADANDDGIIGRFEVVSDTGPGAIRYLGNPFPSHGASLSNALTILDRVHISGLLEYRAGHQLLNRTAWGRCISNVCRELHDPRTSLERQAAAIAGTGAAPFFGFNGSGFIEDADFVKLRELALTVTLPASFASRIGAGSASITLAGRNLLTWTGYSGADPEAIALLRPEETGAFPFDPPAAAGFAVEDYMVQPPPRVWTLRLDVRF